MSKNLYNYIVIVKELENGKFLLTFPDFEGITNTSETEDSIPYVAKTTIKTKLSELKKAGIEIKEPLKMKDISNFLNNGEFTTLVSVSTFNFDIKNFSNLKDKEIFKQNAKEFSDKIDDIVDNKIKNYVTKGNENIIVLTACIISIINTIFFSLLKIKIPFLGEYSIKFFGGLSKLSDFSRDVKMVSNLRVFSGIFILLITGIIIYFNFMKKKQFILYSVYTKAGFLAMFYIFLFVKIFSLDSNVSRYISVSFFKIFLYILSTISIYISCKLMDRE